MNRFSFVCNCGFDARQATSVWRSVELMRITQTEVALTWDDVERRLRTDSYNYLSYLFAERDFAPVISFALIFYSLRRNIIFQHEKEFPFRASSEIEKDEVQKQRLVIEGRENISKKG